VVEGFLHGLEMIQRGQRLFKNFLATDLLFTVKFAYLLHQAFQNFVDRLGDFYQDRKPIRRARRILEHSQKKAIKRAIFGYKVSTIPRLFLPNLLQVKATDNKRQQDADCRGGRPNRKASPNKTD
jgi:hypothetical protein